VAVAEPLTLFTPDASTAAVDPSAPFHPAVQTWFDRRFPEGPTPPQVEGWPAIAAGTDTLIAAPTGSGKTLAGFLTCIDRLYRRHGAGEAIADRAQVVYVSPLKALAVDIAENLERPLAEIAEIATELGFDPPALRVGLRTGDTTPSQRAAMVKRPPNFLITTPESLYLLVTAAKSREILRTIETVIVDEIHAMARDKRGSHLALTLERLEHVCHRRPARVGLSATQRPVERVARLLVGARTTAEGGVACTIVDSGHRQALDLRIELPDGELEAVVSADQMADVLDRIAELVGRHRTTLVFVNTRRLAERLAHQLEERLGEDHVAAHHGSLSRERRQRVERRLRAGDLRVLVATASLELGIDIGPVELVCQIGSPRSIATLLQRVGRSNHTRNGTPRGRLYPLTRDELVECTALLGAIRAGRLDTVTPPDAPLDILGQQLIAEVAAEEWTPDGLFDLVRRADPFVGLDRDTFDEILDLAADGIRTGRGPRARYLHLDRVNGEVRPRKGARLAALTSGGAIPELGDYRVVAEPGETFIGTVTEDWAIESMAGDIFLLGTTSWRIRKVEPGVVRVVDANGAPPSVPFWLGEAPARTAELSEEVSRVRATVDRHLTEGRPDRAHRWLLAACGLDDAAATTVVDYLAAGRAGLGVMPTTTDLVFERFFDESGGMQLVIHSPLGGRLNRALGLALRKKFCRGFNFELQAAASDDAVVLSLGPHHSFPLEDVPRFIASATVEDTLRQAVLDSPLFQSRWRWNLNRFLVVLRWRGGRRNPPPIQRMEADDMMAALFPGAAACPENIVGDTPIPDHPIVRQTMHDTLHEALDVDGLRTLLDDIGADRVRVHFRDTTEASLLSHEILTARPYTFLDDGEAGDRRTNAVPLRRGLPTEAVPTGQILPEAVEQVRAEVAVDPAGPDELHDLLVADVLVTPDPTWAPLFAELMAKGRAATRPGEAGDRWFAIERSAAVEALVTGIDQPGCRREEAAADAVRGHLDHTGPVTVVELADRLGVAPALVEIGLLALESEGSAIRGLFTTEVDGEEQWCARRLLARIHAYSRHRRRREIEPVPVPMFMRFLLAWHGLTADRRRSGPAGVVEAIEQLQGVESAAGSWESDLLAARVRGYRPEWLDRLCHQGEVAWLRLRLPEPGRGANRGPSKATPITLVFRGDLDWLLAAHRGTEGPEIPETGATAEIVEALGARGARFLNELTADTGRLPAEIEDGLWDGVARGLLTADGFAAIRALLQGRRRSSPRPRSVSRLRRGAPPPVRAGGRWSLVGETTAAEDRDELAEAVADQLLARWGVVFRDLVAHERLAVPWRDLQWALRRFEDRGLVRGGRFVNGPTGEQFARPGAIDLLKRVRRGDVGSGRVEVAATDPLNLTGVLFPGPRVPAVRTRRVVYLDGIPEIPGEAA
jgi:ATP-dependent Lhr-like helicase